MPIRFRCPFCQQLLGISRRKAGTNVTCPTCKAQVLVPTETNGPSPAPPGTEPVAPLFEREDFDDYLHGASPSGSPPRPPSAPAEAQGRAPQWGSGVAAPVPPPLAPVAARPPHRPEPSEAPAAGPGFDFPAPAAPEQKPAALVLSSGRVTLLTVVMVILLAIAFGAGLIVGRYL
jgi:hypothetical protein